MINACSESDKQAFDAGKAINSVLELDSVLDVILRSATDLLGGKSGSIMLVEGDELVASTVRGNAAAQGARVPIGDGIAGLWNLSAGAYVQILPKQMEAAGYDPSALGTVDHLVVYAGTYAEIVLPVLVVAGLFTRLAALGMIGFIAVMTWTDITAHGVDYLEENYSTMMQHRRLPSATEAA